MKEEGNAVAAAGRVVWDEEEEEEEDEVELVKKGRRSWITVKDGVEVAVEKIGGISRVGYWVRLGSRVLGLRERREVRAERKARNPSKKRESSSEIRAFDEVVVGSCRRDSERARRRKSSSM